VRRAVFIAATLTAILASHASSQTIAGTVVQSDRTTPVRGAVVVATDEHGQGTRALSANAGTFLLRLPHAGRYSLRVLRIGFRPSDSPSIDVSEDGTNTVTLIADSSPISLAAVTIRAAESCRVHPDTGLLVSRVWEEARTAMMAAQIGPSGAPLEASWMEYDRLLDASGRRVEEQSVRTATHPTTHAFKSVPADSLARYGYVVATAEGTTFFAPDPGVLLSDQFAGTHCFRLAPPAADQQNRIGVEFEPSDERTGVRDIKGTIWVDTKSNELTSLEFAYTNLPDEAIRAGAGGRVAFLRLPDGAWLVESWDVRFPIVRNRDVVRDGGTRRTVYSNDRLELKNIQMTGGRVTSVQRRDSTLFESQGPRVALQLTERDPSVTGAGAHVTLDGTDYSAIADSHGLAQLRSVLDGVYVAHIHLPMLDTLGAAPLEREVQARTDGTVDSLRLPTAQDVLERLCTKQSLREGAALLRGSVADVHGRPVPGSAVTVAWRTLSNAVQLQNPAGPLAERSARVPSDTNGQWRLCGVPRGAVLTVRVSTAEGSDVQRTQIAEAQPWKTVTLVVHPTLASTVNADTSAHASLALSVTNGSGEPIPGVVLSVADRLGQIREASTDGRGSAELPNIAPGQVSIQARRIGFTPGLVTAILQAGSDTLPIVLSDVALPRLDTVRIVAARASNVRHTDFDTRLLHHVAAAAFSRADIEKRSPVDIWQLLSNVTSLTVTQTGSLVTLESSRGQILQHNAIVRCSVLVAVDGAVLNTTGSSVNANELPRPSEVYGVEVFAGPATVPPQFLRSASGAVCGLVAIWTR
jgi:hypothetical protein